MAKSTPSLGIDPALREIEKKFSDFSECLKDVEVSEIDRKSRWELYDKLQRLALHFLTPGEIVEQFLSSSLDITFLKLAADLKLFHLLLEPGSETLNINQICQLTGADETLLGRLMRGLTSMRTIDQINKDTFRANSITSALNSIKACSLTPKFLAETGYRNPTINDSLPFNKAFGSEGFFTVLSSRPQTLSYFELYMKAHREGRTGWLDFYPFSDRVLSGIGMETEHTTTMVDIGGSLGHEIEAVKHKFPGIPGRLILQDLPSTIAKVADDFVGEAIIHDFFTEQPFKGARVYYLRNVLHDWDDESCRSILLRIKEAMRPGYSKILINEFVLPLESTSYFATHSDLIVMALSGAMERTEKQWEDLIFSVNLKIESIWTLDQNTESIIEVVC